MDPYEYLFKTLDIRIIDNVDCKYNMLYCELWFNKQVVDVFSKKITAKDIFQHYTSITSVDLTNRVRSKLSKNLMEYYCIYPRSNLIKILQQFPAKLESKEHVDLLLTLNGINKGA